MRSLGLVAAVAFAVGWARPGNVSNFSYTTMLPVSVN